VDLKERLSMMKLPTSLRHRVVEHGCDKAILQEKMRDSAFALEEEEVVPGSDKAKRKDKDGKGRNPNNKGDKKPKPADVEPEDVSKVVGEVFDSFLDSLATGLAKNSMASP